MSEEQTTEEEIDRHLDGYEVICHDDCGEEITKCLTDADSGSRVNYLLKLNEKELHDVNNTLLNILARSFNAVEADGQILLTDMLCRCTKVVANTFGILGVSEQETKKDDG